MLDTLGGIIGVNSFWLLMALPGVSIARRLTPQLLRGGWLCALALGEAMSWAAAGPLVAVGTWSGWPLTVLSLTCVLGVLFGAYDLYRLGLPKGCERFGLSGCFACASVLAIVVVLAWRVGGYIPGGDSMFHLGRVRMILDHGLNNADPFLGIDTFARVYHTNTYHSLLAVCSQLTGVHYARVWVDTSAWGVLWQASGVYFLTYCVFRRRRAAWFVMMAWVAIGGTRILNVYPNSFVTGFLLAVALGLVVSLPRRAPGYRICAALGLTVLAAAQVHMLYAAFLWLCVAPWLTLRLVLAWVKSKRVERSAVFGLLALCACLPSLAVYKFYDDASVVSAPSEVEAAAPDYVPVHLRPVVSRVQTENVMLLNEDGLMRARKTPFGRLDNWLALVGLGLALRSRSRHRAQFLVFSLGCLAALMYIPWAFTFLCRTLGGTWIPLRTFALINLLHLPGLATIASAAYRHLKARGIRFAEPVVVSAWLALVLGHHVGRPSPLDATFWPRVFNTSTRERPLPYRTLLAEFIETETQLRKQIEPGHVLLARKYTSARLAPLLDASFLSVPNPSPGIKGRLERERDLELLLTDDIDPQERQRLLSFYGIRQAIMGTRKRTPK